MQIPTPKTARRVRVWSALLVGLPDDMAARCDAILAPMSIVRARDAAEAIERLPTVQPLLAVTLRDADVAQSALLRERATDVGASLVVVARDASPVELEKVLRRALAEAETKED